jgi:tetratricopeptide (TPR) repeat protein
MTFTPPNLIKLLAPLAVFGVLLAVLTLANCPPGEPSVAASSLGAVSGRSGAETTRELQAAIAANPADASAYAALGDDFLERARETGDPGYYARADRAYAAALRRDPRDLGAVIGAGTLANLRHDFRAGLRLGRRAHALQPGLARPYVVLADAQIELGRYDAALDSIQRLVDDKPGLAAYARASYYRELSGDRDGAIEAMRLALSAGGEPESVAYVEVLLGDLQLAQGETRAARDAYRAALAAVPDYPQGLAGLARVALAGGDVDAAAARLRRSTDRLPLTTNLTLLADVELAAGHREAAAAQLEVVRAQQRLLGAAGAVPDAERVLFEANHGSPARAVELGRDVWRQAPSVRSADALGWALTRSGRPGKGLRWAQRALRLGSRDPLFRLHAGIAARQVGRSRQAAADLRNAALGRALLPPTDARRLAGALR